MNEDDKNQPDNTANDERESDLQVQEKSNKSTDSPALTGIDSNDENSGNDNLNNGSSNEPQDTPDNATTEGIP